VGNAVLPGIAQNPAACHQVESQVMNPAGQHYLLAPLLKEHRHPLQRGKRHKIERPARARKQVPGVEHRQQRRHK